MAYRGRRGQQEGGGGPRPTLAGFAKRLKADFQNKKRPKRGQDPGEQLRHECGTGGTGGTGGAGGAGGTGVGSIFCRISIKNPFFIFKILPGSGIGISPIEKEKKRKKKKKKKEKDEK